MVETRHVRHLGVLVPPVMATISAARIRALLLEPSSEQAMTEAANSVRKVKLAATT
jgi:hypothetical protein